jgi:hypothetical protein
MRHMYLSHDQIKTFFDRVAESTLECGFSMADINTQEDFYRLVDRYFGKSISRLILDEDALQDIPLLINGTAWEQVIAKWRMCLR